MSSIPVPNQCIWCLTTPPQASFDISHVMPRCTGNNDYTILTAGIVCKKCNNYFGSKVEPILLNDPLFKIIAVVLKLTNPRTGRVFRFRIFDDGRPFIDTKPNHLSMKVNLQPPSTISVDLDWKESGRISRTYSQRDFAFLSRAVHKIAFEMYAWTHFVQGNALPFPIFNPMFNHVRQWVRYGQPQSSVRPVIRRMGLKPMPEVEMLQWKFPSDVAVEMRLFGDWYIVSIGSEPSIVKKRIAQLAPNTDRTWVISEEISTASKFIQIHKNA